MNNQTITIEIECVMLECDCYVKNDPPQYWNDYPGYFECDVEKIEVNGVNVTELITARCPELFRRIEEKCAENSII